MDKSPRDKQPLISEDTVYSVPGIGDSVSSAPEQLKGGKIQWSEDQPMRVDTSKLQRDAMKPIHFAAYSVGHFNNDLVAGLGFTY